MGVKIQGVNHGYTLELYTATYTGNSLYNARNRPIQQTRPVPRDCIAIQLYSASLYSRAIHSTAYTLYSPIRRPSGVLEDSFCYNLLQSQQPTYDTQAHTTSQRDEARRISH